MEELDLDEEGYVRWDGEQSGSLAGSPELL
jgi:hypothetical protein